MLLPIGHEGDSVRRIPWVTVAIMALCIIIHIMTSSSVSYYEQQYNTIGGEIIDYYRTHAYLELDPEIKKQFMLSEEMEEFLKSMAIDKYSKPQDQTEKEEQQAYLDQLIQDLKDTRDMIPYFKWGFIPAKKKISTYITHMFLHADWLHLLGNLFFLYLMGPFLEDVWGKVTYGVFYIVAGILAAQAFAMHYPHSLIPTIGASGAISGVMGGFLVRHWKVRIKYFYMFSILVRGTFSAPAWVMLPIGLFKEIFDAALTDKMFSQGGGGVAHWAHVWGFIFGAVGALAIKYFKIEEKFVAPKIEAKTTYVNKSYAAYEEAMELLNSGDKEKAYGMLLETARQDPSNQDVVEALWNLAPEMETEREIAPFLARVVEKEVQQSRMDLAMFHFRQLRSKCPEVPLSTHAKILLFEQSVNEKDLDESKGLFHEIVPEVNLSSPPGFLLDFCAGALKYDLIFDQSAAHQVIGLALKHPDIPQLKKESLKTKLAEIPAQKKRDFIKAGGPAEIPGPGGPGGLVSGAAAALGTTGAEGLAGTGRGAGMGSGMGGHTPGGLNSAWGSPGSTFPADPTAPAATAFDQPPPIPAEARKPTDPEPVIKIKPMDPGETLEVIKSDETYIMMGNSAAQPPPIPTEATVPVEPGPVVIPIIPPELPGPQETLEPETSITPPPPAVRKRFRITPAIPLGVKEKKISLEVENRGERLFALDKIKAMAVVKIAPPEQRPFLLVDLLVDDPASPVDGEVIRTIRFNSTNFNPKKFVPRAQGPLEAFKYFTTVLHRLSNSKPYPDLDSVQLKKVTTFASISEYENFLLKTGEPSSGV
jgi:membrane associated rhomboid family serine protease